jgi:hypothetical protein
MKKNIIRSLCILALLALSIDDLYAQWSNDPNVNTPICTAPLNQSAARIISDGQGGTIIAWMEDQQNANGDIWIYAQRVNSLGVTQWQTNGVLICAAIGARTFYTPPSMVSDGTGGAIIVWVDQRNAVGNFDIYAQRIDGSGIVQWTTDGIPVCALPNANENPDIVSDGNGGAIICWSERGPRLPTVYAQRISNAGSLLWTPDGVPLSIDAEGQLQTFPKLVSDGQGGAFVVWEDRRSLPTTQQSSIFGQYVNQDGQVQWNPDGIGVGLAGNLTQTFNQAPQLISDGSGGIIVTWWRSYFDGTNTFESIFVNQTNSNGSSNWTKEIVSGTDNHRYSQLTTDGLGGTIVTWYDTRDSSDQIYAQRIKNDGTVFWQPNGIQIKINSDPLGNTFLKPISDNAGGAIVVWNDFRTLGIYPKIFAQRIDPNGNTLWQNDGATICSYDGSLDPVTTTDGFNGAVVAWWGARPADQNIYAQQINGNGLLGIVTDVETENLGPTNFSLDQNYPNPFNPSTTIRYTIPNVTLSRAEGSRVQLKVYDVLGNEVATLVDENKPAGSYEVEFSAKGGSARGGNAYSLSSGVYFYKLQTGSFVETKKMILMK